MEKSCVTNQNAIHIFQQLIQLGHTSHSNTYCTAMTKLEHKSSFELTRDTTDKWQDRLIHISYHQSGPMNRFISHSVSPVSGYILFWSACLMLWYMHNQYIWYDRTSIVDPCTANRAIEITNYVSQTEKMLLMINIGSIHHHIWYITGIITGQVKGMTHVFLEGWLIKWQDFYDIQTTLAMYMVECYKYWHEILGIKVSGVKATFSLIWRTPQFNKCISDFQEGHNVSFAWWKGQCPQIYSKLVENANCILIRYSNVIWISSRKKWYVIYKCAFKMFTWIDVKH